MAAGIAPGGLSPKQLILFLLLYYGLQVLIRTLLSPSADMDESEQLVLSQKLSWGYGSDPPLYTWIQSGFFAVFGQTIFALSLFKNLLLFTTSVFTWLNARLITRSELCAAAATISLFYIPQVAWESQRDLTHSVLSATFATATLYIFLRLLGAGRVQMVKDSPSSRPSLPSGGEAIGNACKDSRLGGRSPTFWYVAFGLCAGFGMLSKYNYVFWPISLVIASLTNRQFRPAVADKRMLIALALSTLVFLPNALWILNHRELALMTSAKLKIVQSASWGSAALHGMKNLVMAILSFVGPIAAVYAIMFSKPSVGKPSLQPESGLAEEFKQLISRALLVILTMLLLIVLGFRATGLRERYLQPILICLPVLGIVVVRKKLNLMRFKWMATITGAVMLTVLIAMPARIVFAKSLKREQPLNLPYAELAAQMLAVIPPSTLLVADTDVLGGNLHVSLPGKIITTPRRVGFFESHDQHCMLVWDARKRVLPPEAMQEWAASIATINWNDAHPQYFTADFLYDRSRQMKVGLLQIR